MVVYNRDETTPPVCMILRLQSSFVETQERERARNRARSKASKVDSLVRFSQVALGTPNGVHKRCSFLFECGACH